MVPCTCILLQHSIGAEPLEEKLLEEKLLEDLLEDLLESLKNLFKESLRSHSSSRSMRHLRSSAGYNLLGTSLFLGN